MQSEQKNQQTDQMDIQVDETLYRQAQQIASWYGLTIDQAIYYCFRAILVLPESQRIAYLMVSPVSNYEERSAQTGQTALHTKNFSFMGRTPEPVQQNNLLKPELSQHPLPRQRLLQHSVPPARGKSERSGRADRPASIHAHRRADTG